MRSGRAAARIIEHEVNEARGAGVPTGQLEVHAEAGLAHVTVRDGSETWEASCPVSLLRTALTSGGSALSVVAAAMLGEAWVPGASRPWRPTRSSLDERLVGTTATARDEQIGRALTLGDVLLIGSSASGKTVSSCTAASRWISDGGAVIWLDLIDSSLYDQALVEEILISISRGEGRVLIVIDNVQANPTLAGSMSTVIGRSRPYIHGSLRALLVGWPSVWAMRDRIGLKVADVVVHGEEVIRDLIATADCSSEVGAAVSHLAQGDVLIAAVALKYFSEYGKVPTLDEVSGLIVAERPGVEDLDHASRTLFFWFASLGMYEIEVTKSYAATLDQDAIERLQRSRCIVSDGDALSVGHKSLAALLVRYARREWGSDVGMLQSPGRVAVDFLRTAGDRQILATLEKLDLVGLAESGSDQHGSAFLARCWQSLSVLGAYLVKHARDDPTWGRNLASCVFACDALAQLHKREEWQLSADFVRSAWDYGDGSRLPRPIGEVTAEWFDFPEIQKAMRAEDGVGVSPMRADGIDMDRMHRTWVTGLLLGLEGAAPERQASRIETLKAIAATAQEPDGNFYPARVPWITARVILGLRSAGDSYESSDVVRRACDWLRSPSPGPYSFGAWESGSGAWNSQLMTTAMCLAALGQAGVQMHEPVMVAGAAYLKSKRSDWGQPGSEIDTALVLEASLLAGERWRDVSADMSQLISWARDRSAWVETSRLAPDAGTESSKVAFIASELVAIVWAIVKRELAVLLEGVATYEMQTLEESVPTLDEVTPAARELFFLDLERVLDAVGMNISDREAAANFATESKAAAFQLSLPEWREVEQQARALRRDAELAISRDTWDEIVERLNKLGHRVRGPAWMPLEPGS